MKVKIGDHIYDDRKEPIMVILSETDKLYIGEMPEGQSKYCSFPSDSVIQDIHDFMRGEYL